MIRSTAFSSGGTYLAVGTDGNSNYVRVFAKNGTNYETMGETIIGEGGLFGWTIDMSADGSAFVVSDYSFENAKGKVYLYDATKPPLPFSSPMSIAPTASSSLPQSSSPMSNAKTFFYLYDAVLDVLITCSEPTDPLRRKENA